VSCVVKKYVEINEKLPTLILPNSLSIAVCLEDVEIGAEIGLISLTVGYERISNVKTAQWPVGTVTFKPYIYITNTLEFLLIA
jgi:hypothetical protein